MIDNFSVTCTGTGIGEIETVSPFIIYPNPTSGIARIRSVDKTEILSIRLIDPSGRIQLTDTKTTIDLTALSAGLYFMEILTVKGKFSHRLIKY